MHAKYGFELERSAEIAELSSQAQVLTHIKSGARVLSLSNADENKVFGIAFRTPPTDGTGLPHILEHSVLCGSRKYPVKEPFVELLKGSLHTYLNALTFPDKTCYPVASTNAKDFYNLVDVYLDAVFFPRLTEQVLMQEGWHYEVDPEGGAFNFKGVVFNEMKGAYSSPDGLLHQYSQEAVFPATTYGLESGGDPAVIPDLTFAQFADFHRRYYHPSNAYVCWYGDDDPERRLAIMAEYFDAFERIEPGSAIALQARWRQPNRVHRVYAVTADEEQGDERKRAMCTINLLLDETHDPEQGLALQILEHILIGLPSSPLRKALIDADLGEDLAGVGLEDELRQMYFSVGLKGIAAAAVDDLERLVLSTLERMSREGIAAGDIEAAINSVEFALRENNTGSFPRGLALMFRALSTWLYDGDPLALLPFEAPLARLKARLDSGERVFEDLIQRWLVDNPHRVTVLLAPDPGVGPAREAVERRRLDHARRAMSDTDAERIAAQASALRERQERPDSVEDLATIPRLTLGDLPSENRPIPCAVTRLADVEVLEHELHTNGIVYLDLGFDLRGVPERLLGLVPVFGRALFELGTSREDEVTFAQRIARKTGGIYPQLFISSVRGGGDAAARLMVRGKATTEMVGELVDILDQALRDANFGRHERLRQIVAEAQARREQRLIPAGHMLAARRLQARFSWADALQERIEGLSGLFFIRELGERLERDVEGVQADLEELRRLLLTRSRTVANVTADRRGLGAACDLLGGLFGPFPDGTIVRELGAGLALPSREGLSVPTQVNYVAKGAEVFGQGYVYTGAAHVIAQYLGTTFLWDKVRVQGGAYGAFCLFDRLAGSLGFVSYRDPNIASTLAIFDQVAAFLRQPVARAEIDKAVIGAIGDIDTYRLPDAKGYASLARHLTGQDEIFLQQVREEVLATRQEDFALFADAAQTVARAGAVVVVGKDEDLRALRPELSVTKVL